MTSVQEYLEKAYASAMYEGLDTTAGLIAAALETVSIREDCSLEKAPQNMKNVVVFPKINQK